MKKIILGAIGVSLAVISVCASAETTQPMTMGTKIVVSGQPVVLQKTSGNMYTAPAGLVVSAGGFYYVSLNNRAHACWPTPQSSLAKDRHGVISVTVNNSKTTWYCYEVNPEFFEMKP